jgi:hypothetical protein
MRIATDTPTHAAVHALAGLETAELRALLLLWTKWRDHFASQRPAIAELHNTLLILAAEVRDARLAVLRDALREALDGAAALDAGLDAAAGGVDPFPPAPVAVADPAARLAAAEADLAAALAAAADADEDEDAILDPDDLDPLGAALADLTDGELQAMAAKWQQWRDQYAARQPGLRAVYAALAAVAAEEQATRRRLFAGLAGQFGGDGA